MPRPADPERLVQSRTGETTIAAELHRLLAYGSALLIVLVGLEASWRAWRRSRAGAMGSRIEALLVLALVVTSAGGLGLLAGGARPREVLHFIYAVVVLGALPVTNSLARHAGPRVQGIASLLGALIALAVIVRLSDTG